MLKNPEKFNSFLQERREFSFKTFGSREERDHIGPLTHLKKEVQELLDNPSDPMEWADCLMLFLDAAERKGISFDELIEFCGQKLAINKKRQWVKQSDGTFRHVQISCPQCDNGGIDTGGQTPWGTRIIVPCPSCYPES